MDSCQVSAYAVDYGLEQGHLGKVAHCCLQNKASAGADHPEKEM
jgi:hypothetical protein